MLYVDDETLQDFFEDLRIRGYGRNTRIAYRSDLADFFKYARHFKLVRDAPDFEHIFADKT